MNRRYAVRVGLILCLVAAVSCAKDDGADSPKPIDGVLLRASDLPGMRLLAQDPIADAVGLAETLGGPESCACPTVFKDDTPVVVEKLKEFGFERGYAEQWVGAGLQAASFVAEFDTAAHAEAALGYMDDELFRDCIDEDYCSKRVRITNPTIPDFVGLALTPLRPAEEGRQATLYKFLFRSGTTVYGVMDGADNAFDPGSVSQAEAVGVVEELYDRVKDRDIKEVLRSAPPSHRGPPHGPPEPPPEEPPPPAS